MQDTCSSAIINFSVKFPGVLIAWYILLYQIIVGFSNMEEVGTIKARKKANGVAVAFFSACNELFCSQDQATCINSHQVGFFTEWKHHLPLRWALWGCPHHTLSKEQMKPLLKCFFWHILIVYVKIPLVPFWQVGFLQLQCCTGCVPAGKTIFFSFPGICKGRSRLLFVEIDCISHKSHFDNLLEARMNLGLERALGHG